MLREVRCANAYARALEIEPQLQYYIDELGVNDVIRTVCAAPFPSLCPVDHIYKIKEARRNARGEDAKKVKELVVNLRFRQWTLEIRDSDDRMLPGWYHPEMGRMLCPTIYDFSNLEYVLLSHPTSAYSCSNSIQRRLQHMIIKPNPLLYPPFMYKNETIYPTNLFRGFLKNEMLVKVR